ncbi:MAG: aminoacyl-histidine dipeptidase [Candidatus Kapabacteria bacterium]|nr:aminoacyl-histidine dipeptidase [Candidatus Kapabacteria bacterium]
MGNVLGGLKPQKVWEFFEAICSYPRPSKKEEKIAAYIMDFAKEYKLKAVRDSAGNIIIKKPATKGMENRKTVCVQGHIDMVCEKNNDVEFDFDVDGIQPWIDGEWVKAKGTTLGADNGIGVAMAMAVLASNDIEHPDFEALFTIDEETGLTGAQALAPNILKADILINLDSEEDGAFTIGCAGGINTAAIFDYHADTLNGEHFAFEIALKGLRGGHSGIEIHDERGNAIKILNRLIWNLTHKYNVRLATFNSGNKHNAIPREGFAVIACARPAKHDVANYITEFNSMVHFEYETKEPNLHFVTTAVDIPDKVMTVESQRAFLNALYACPHGVIRNSPDIENLVQTSTNLAVVETFEKEIKVVTSQRSSAESEKMDLATMVRTVFELAGARLEAGDGYPGWQPNINSPILKLCKDISKEVYGKEPKVEAIHAGLECGLIGEKYPGMDMISFGPTLKDVHSPDEKILIHTVENCWNLFLGILKNIPA